MKFEIEIQSVHYAEGRQTVYLKAADANEAIELAKADLPLNIRRWARVCIVNAW